MLKSSMLIQGMAQATRYCLAETPPEVQTGPPPGQEFVVLPAHRFLQGRTFPGSLHSWSLIRGAVLGRPAAVGSTICTIRRLRVLTEL
jgi:hypothetical protein